MKIQPRSNCLKSTAWSKTTPTCFAPLIRVKGVVMSKNKLNKQQRRHREHSSNSRSRNRPSLSPF
jgi:hypothetical protein